MAACRCGAPIAWAQTVEGRRVPLDAHDSFGGPYRYRVISYGSTWLVEPISADAGAGHADHRVTCSALGDAERMRVLASLGTGDADAEVLYGGAA